MFINVFTLVSSTTWWSRLRLSSKRWNFSRLRQGMYYIFLFYTSKFENQIINLTIFKSVQSVLIFINCWGVHQVSAGDLCLQRLVRHLSPSLIGMCKLDLFHQFNILTWCNSVLTWWKNLLRRGTRSLKLKWAINIQCLSHVHESFLTTLYISCTMIRRAV